MEALPNQTCASATLTASWAVPVAHALPTWVMQKLDPWLKELARQRRPPSTGEPARKARPARPARPTRAAVPRARAATTPAEPADAVVAATRRVPERVNITVKFTGDLADLTALGFEAPTILSHLSKGFSIAAGSIPAPALEALASIEHVVKIEGSRPLRPELNHSVEEVHAGTGSFPASQFNGRGVVIGVIDTGFDYRHQVFRKQDGKTRILALWDQTLTLQGAEAGPAGFPAGVEYRQPLIDAALAAADPLSIVRSNDRLGHGTHVAGIAAGDGSQAGNCRGAFTFVGLAPAAELILVKVPVAPDAIGEAQNVVHAFDYIFQHPSAAGRPVVINLSQGDHLGAHDGTSLLEQAIDILLLQPRRAVVKSAGNAANKDRHAEGTAPALGSVDIDFEVQPKDSSVRRLELWYPGTGTLGIRVVAPGTPEQISEPVDPGSATERFNVGAQDPTAVFIDSMDQDPDNHDKRITVRLEPPLGGADLPAGGWKLRLSNAGAAATPFHCWIDADSADKRAPKFRSHVSKACTISIPGTAENVITVAGYATEGWTSGQLADFSGRGPTRDGRTKPDIAAPGVAITSARANQEGSRCSDCCVDFYKDESGTSVASPHVAGAIALMLQKDPDQNAALLLARLRAGARVPDGVSTPLPDNDWGSGKLNVGAALNAVPAPGGGGGGGGGPIPFTEPSHTLPLPSGPALSRPRRRRDRPSQPLAMTPAFTALRRRALASPTGQLYAALISRNFSEVRGLIRSNRRVAAVWQRIGGPQLIQQVAQRVFDGDRPLPVTLEGVHLASGVRRFLDILQRYGSLELRADIERHGALMLALEGRSLNQLTRSLYQVTA